MNTARSEGGKVVSVKLDDLSRARLQYLDAFFRRVCGVRASNSTLVRYAVGVLVDDVAKLIKLHRKDAEAAKVILAGLAIGWAARDNPSPFRAGMPDMCNAEQFPSFPLWSELETPRKHAPLITLPSCSFQSNTCTNERD